MWWMELLNGDDGVVPKRGDLIQSNVGDKRERTWFILRATKMRRKDPAAPPRYQIFRARWWELEPEFRMKLFRSASRNGRQRVWYLDPNWKPKRKKQTFEEHMQREFGGIS